MLTKFLEETENVIWANWGLKPGRQSLRELWELLQINKGEGQNIHDFNKRGIYSQAYISTEGCCLMQAIDS